MSSEKLSSIKCRMKALSTETRYKEKQIHRALNKVKNMLSTTPDLNYVAPEVLMELIRFRLIKLYPKLEKIIQMQNQLETCQNELNIVILEFDEIDVNVV